MTTARGYETGMLKHISIEQFFDSPAMRPRVGYFADIFKNEVNERVLYKQNPDADSVAGLKQRVDALLGFCKKLGSRGGFVTLMIMAYTNFTDEVLLFFKSAEGTWERFTKPSCTHSVSTMLT